MISVSKDPVKPRGSLKVLRVHYDSIELHMELILQKLWDMIYNATSDAVSNKNLISISVKKALDNGSVTYDVRLNIDTLDKAYNFLKLYLYNVNLLQEIKSDDGYRRTFFRNIEKLGQDMRGKNLGSTPAFDIKIK